MFRRAKRAVQQLGFLGRDTRGMVGRSWWRWGGVWFTGGFATVASYRLSRMAYLALGPAYSAARIPLSPLLFALRPWMGGCDIHYMADIGPGLRVLHPALGVVISAKTIAGSNLILTGGNCVGARKEGEIRIGDDVTLGANASILGPVTVGSRVKLGAHALVVQEVPDGEVVMAPLPATQRASSDRRRAAGASAEGDRDA